MRFTLRQSYNSNFILHINAYFGFFFFLFLDHISSILYFLTEYSTQLIILMILFHLMIKGVAPVPTFEECCDYALK